MVLLHANWVLYSSLGSLPPSTASLNLVSRILLSVVHVGIALRSAIIVSASVVSVVARLALLLKVMALALLVITLTLTRITVVPFLPNFMVVGLAVVLIVEGTTLAGIILTS